MRAVDPTAKIFFNENAITPASLERFLNEVGNDAFDGVEFHGKMAVWIPRAAAVRDVAEWLEGGAAHRARERPDVARQDWWHARPGDQTGEAHSLLTNNEYGLGHSENLVSFNKYTKSLVVVELALEMFVAGYDVAFWDNGDGGNFSRQRRPHAALHRGGVPLQPDG